MNIAIDVGRPDDADYCCRFRVARGERERGPYDSLGRRPREVGTVPVKMCNMPTPC